MPNHSPDCIFCKIVNNELTSPRVHETDQFIVINDISPKAPVHLLVIPKQPITTLEEVELGKTELMGELLKTAREAAKLKQIDSNYKLVMNVGPGVQAVHHLHLHILGGWQQATPDQKSGL